MKVLITGATEGLGKGLATKLAGEGHTLVLHGRDEGRGEQTIREIAGLTGNDRLSFYRADFASLQQVRAMAQRILSDHDALDVLVNNAGVGSTLPGDGERMEIQRHARGARRRAGVRRAGAPDAARDLRAIRRDLVCRA